MLTVWSAFLPGLVNYWPITKGLLIDVIAGKDLAMVGGTFTVRDRFGTANGAMASFEPLEEYWEAPAGVYFSGDFSITAWVKLTSASPVIVLASANSESGYEVELYVAADSVMLRVTAESSTASVCNSPVQVPSGVWVQVATVASGSTAMNYMNGQLISTCGAMTVPSVMRSWAYMGFSGDEFNAKIICLDEIKIYNRALSAQEIGVDFVSTESFI
jgi:hypothetical protein